MRDLLSCSGTSDWTGTWKGSTTWTLTGDVSLAAGGSGRIDEVFTGRTRDGRKGKLTFVEHFTLDAAGHIDIKGKIVKSSGRLAGSHGKARWIRTANADGSGAGTYSAAGTRVDSGTTNTTTPRFAARLSVPPAILGG
jgi:hypothetical protein